MTIALFSFYLFASTGGPDASRTAGYRSRRRPVPSPAACGSRPAVVPCCECHADHPGCAAASPAARRDAAVVEVVWVVVSLALSHFPPASLIAWALLAGRPASAVDSSRLCPSGASAPRAPGGPPTYA